MSKEKEKQDKRYRNFRILLYPDNPAHNLAVIRLSSAEFNAVGMLHDKDIYTDDDPERGISKGDIEKKHWHFVVKFKNAKTFSSLAKELDIEPKFIQKCDSYKGALLYLTHANNPDKYQYSPFNAAGSLAGDLVQMSDCRPEYLKILDIAGYISDFKGKIKLSDVLVYSCSRGLYATYRRDLQTVRELIGEHNERFYLSQRGI